MRGEETVESCRSSDRRPEHSDDPRKVNGLGRFGGRANAAKSNKSLIFPVLVPEGEQPRLPAWSASPPIRRRVAAAHDIRDGARPGASGTPPPHREFPRLVRRSPPVE